MKTSVALCTYNGEKYLREQLDSILYQTLPVDEVVVCDDGSTDATLEILEEYSTLHPGRFLTHFNDKNLGVIKNFEKAIHQCSGDIIFLSDQDDVWQQNKVYNLVKYFTDHEDCEAVFHNQKLLSENGMSRITNWDAIHFNPEKSKISLLDYLIFIGNCVTGGALAFRRNAFKFEFIDDSKYFLHDYQLALHFAIDQGLHPLSSCLSVYRLHSTQVVGIDLQSQIRTKRYNQFVSATKTSRRKLFSEKYREWKSKDQNKNINKKLAEYLSLELKELTPNSITNINFILRILLSFKTKFLKVMKIMIKTS